MESMKNKLHKICLLLLCLYSFYFVSCAFLSPICAYTKNYELSAKLTSMFIYSCHQQPDRSFWILNYPMPLCARCYGVYLSTFLFSILSIFKQIKINKYILFVFCLIVFTDISLNCGFFSKQINTGNIIRFLTGNLIGLILIVFINKLFEFERRKND